MSITSVGFSPWETLPANTMLRVTIAQPSLVWDAFDRFAAAAKDLYGRMYSVTGVIPSTPLAVVTGDQAAVIDGLIHRETRGADLLNALESLQTQLAFVSRVERLSQRDRAASNTNAGASDRADDQTSAENAADLWSGIAKQFGSLSTALKWAGVLVGVVAVAYVVHEFKPGRK